LAALAILATLRIAYTYANTAACERTAPRLRYIIATRRAQAKNVYRARGMHAEAVNPPPPAACTRSTPRGGGGGRATSLFARAEKNSGRSSAIRAAFTGALERRQDLPRPLPLPSPSSPSQPSYLPNQTVARGFQRATGLMAIMHF